MDNNKFNEQSKEQLEKEIQELKRQKEIRELQKQKEELEKTMFGSIGGSEAEKNKEINERNEDNKEEIKSSSNKKLLTLLGIAASFIIIIGSGILYINAQNNKKRESVKKSAVSTILQSQNMASITTPQPNTTGGSGKEAAENTLKEAIDILQKGDYSSITTDKNELDSMNLFKEAYKKISYKINNATETQGKVVLNVTMKYPDLSEIKTLVNKKVIDNAQQLKGQSEATIEKQTMKWMKEFIDQKLNNSNLKYSEKTFDLTYTNVNGEWTQSNEANSDFNKVMTFDMDM
jgi:hypothetical protein